ncbi:E3 ubiquitin-protein ligase rnf8-like [Hetaerina americana]|uniref:E3 ubiquitin-protein ligase rnf8-like n=1 Tax=Hetaerina americana TaxID=62018 RepID=UPI003A7F37A8
MDSEEKSKLFHYLYAVEYEKRRIQRPETMTFVLGRSKCSDLIITSKKVARKQCEIVCSGDSWMLRNLSATGTPFVGRLIVRDEAVNLHHEDIMKIGGIYIQFLFQIDSAIPPLRILRIIALIGENYCHLAEDSAQRAEPIEWNIVERANDSKMENPSANSETENACNERDATIKDLTSENEHLMKELKEMKAALKKALTEKCEAEFKMARVAEELKLIQDLSENGNVIGEIVENELQCSVCSELIIDAITLDCSHTFCHHCLVQWKKKSTFCPMCRSITNFECKPRVIDNLIEKIIGNLPVDTQRRRKELSDARKASKKRRKSHGRGCWNKRKRPVIVQVSEPSHEVIRISMGSADDANVTIDITSDDDDN